MNNARWEVEVVQLSGFAGERKGAMAHLSKLLDEGWEPFAATGGYESQVVFLRRARSLTTEGKAGGG